MPNYLVHGRLVGCAIAQVIEADDAETAAEIFADADWRPVVASVSDAPVGVIPGRTTLTVTVPTESRNFGSIVPRPHATSCGSRRGRTSSPC